ncbi:MAG: hypothetical protein ACXQTJ_00875 [Candidatus Syntropharchaeales archaeon]
MQKDISDILEEVLTDPHVWSGIRFRNEQQTFKKKRNKRRVNENHKQVGSLLERCYKAGIESIASPDNSRTSFDMGTFSPSASTLLFPVHQYIPINHNNGHSFDPSAELAPDIPHIDRADPIDREPITEMDIGDRYRDIEKRETIIRTETPLFTIEKSMKDLMKKDELSNELITFIRQRLKELLIREDFRDSVHITVDHRSDVEDDKWKKIVIDFHIEDDDTEEKMELWDVLIDHIDKLAQQVLTEKKHSRTERKHLQELLDSMYVFINI